MIIERFQREQSIAYEKAKAFATRFVKLGESIQVSTP